MVGIDECVRENFMRVRLLFWCDVRVLLCDLGVEVLRGFIDL